MAGGWARAITGGGGKRKRGAHAAPRPGDTTPATPDETPRQSPVMLALLAVADGRLPDAVTHLEHLGEAGIQAAGRDAATLALLTTAVIRRLRERAGIRTAPPPGFAVCLDCQLGNRNGCRDPLCAHYPRPRPAARRTPPAPAETLLPAPVEVPAAVPPDIVPDPDGPTEDAKDICD